MKTSGFRNNFDVGRRSTSQFCLIPSVRLLVQKGAQNTTHSLLSMSDALVQRRFTSSFVSWSWRPSSLVPTIPLIRPRHKLKANPVPRFRVIFRRAIRPLAMCYVHECAADKVRDIRYRSWPRTRYNNFSTGQLLAPPSARNFVATHLRDLKIYEARVWVLTKWEKSFVTMCHNVTPNKNGKQLGRVGNIIKEYMV